MSRREERGIGKRPTPAEMGESDAEEGENHLCRERPQRRLPRLEEQKTGAWIFGAWIIGAGEIEMWGIGGADI
jgi:hypothetical protein